MQRAQYNDPVVGVASLSASFSASFSESGLRITPCVPNRPQHDFLQLISNKLHNLCIDLGVPIRRDSPSRLQLPMHSTDVELEPGIQRKVPFAEPAGALRASDLDKLPGALKGHHVHGNGAFGVDGVRNALGTVRVLEDEGSGVRVRCR